MSGPRDRRRRGRRPAIAGAALCVVALALALADPAAALSGWLVAFVFWSALPIGGLVLAMMMALIPGAWREELRDHADAATLLMPLAAAAAAPLLIGVGAVYPWTAVGGFAGYLAPVPFALRTVAFFAFAGAAAALVTTRRRAVPMAAAGLCILVPAHTVVAVDWLMSLSPGFHSSGFGLYVLSIQATAALCFVVLARLWRDGRPVHGGLLGSLLLTALLLCLYLSFMQFVILWSGNLPQGAQWYLERSAGGWIAVEYAVGAIQLAAVFVLLFPPLRRHRRTLAAISLAVLCAKALEVAWLVLPSVDAGVAAAGAALVATPGLGLLAVGGFIAALPRLGTLRTSRLAGWAR